MLLLLCLLGALEVSLKVVAVFSLLNLGLCLLSLGLLGCLHAFLVLLGLGLVLDRLEAEVLRSFDKLTVGVSLNLLLLSASLFHRVCLSLRSRVHSLLGDLSNRELDQFA